MSLYEGYVCHIYDMVDCGRYVCRDWYAAVTLLGD